MRIELLVCCGVLSGTSVQASAQAEWTLTPESSALVAAYGANVVLSDVDGDGEITNLDFGVWLKVLTSQVYIADVNSNGVIDSIDAQAQLAQILSLLANDIDQSGTVDDIDLESAVAHAATGSPGGDVNGDGVTNDIDIELIATALGTSTTFDAGVVATSMIGELAAVNVHSNFFSELVPGWKPGDSDPTPPNHDPTITRQWPPTHQTSVSGERWPPNHYADISQDWETNRPPTHNVRNSRIDWPPNHGTAASNTWPGQPSPTPHVIDTSRKWPPNHTYANSSSPAVHDDVYSRLRPTDPEFPPIPSFPRFPRPWTEHHTTISNTWTPHHAESTSRSMWPPSHGLQESHLWPQLHMFHVSTTWPPNHRGNISSSWPKPDDPSKVIIPNWPANHLTEISNSWPNNPPPPVNPWFPPGHTMIKTAKDIVPLLPSEPSEPQGE